MSSSTLTVEVDDRIATALSQLNGRLAVDGSNVDGLLRDSLARAAERLGEIAESRADLLDPLVAVSSPRCASLPT